MKKTILWMLILLLLCNFGSATIYTWNHSFNGAGYNYSAWVPSPASDDCIEETGGHLRTAFDGGANDETYGGVWFNGTPFSIEYGDTWHMIYSVKSENDAYAFIGPAWGNVSSFDITGRTRNAPYTFCIFGGSDNTNDLKLYENGSLIYDDDGSFTFKLNNYYETWEARGGNNPNGTIWIAWYDRNGLIKNYTGKINWSDWEHRNKLQYVGLEGYIHPNSDHDADIDWVYIEVNKIDPPTPLSISDINCTSPPGDTIPPFWTDDKTPTFSLTTNYATNCSISNTNSSYALCSTTNSTHHICTINTTQAFSIGSNYVYFNCTGITGNFTDKYQTIISYEHGINISKMYFYPNISNYNIVTGMIKDFNVTVKNQTITNPYITFCAGSTGKFVGWINQTHENFSIKCNTSWATAMDSGPLSSTKNVTLNSSIISGSCNNVFCFMDFNNVSSTYYFMDYWGVE